MGRDRRKGLIAGFKKAGPTLKFTIIMCVVSVGCAIIFFIVQFKTGATKKDLKGAQEDRDVKHSQEIQQFIEVKELIRSSNVPADGKFHPLSRDIREQVIARLERVADKYTKLTPTIIFRVAQGDERRNSAAKGLADLFQQASVNALVESYLLVGGAKSTFVKVFLHPDDTVFAKDLLHALSPVWNIRKYTAFTAGDLERGEIQIRLNRTPKFESDGFMQFGIADK